MSIRSLITVVAVALAVMAGRAEAPDSVCARFDGRALTDIEGVWQWTTGATVAITADEHGRVVLTLIDSPDPFVCVPQVMGHGSFGGKEGTYNLKIYSKINSKTGLFDGTPANIVANVSHDGQLTLTPYSTGLRVNIRRLIPYLFRFSISRDKAPDGLEGAHRVYPRRGTPVFPVVI